MRRGGEKRPCLIVCPCGGYALSTCDHLTADRLTPIHGYNHAWLDCARKWLRLQWKIT